jgi:hypothetical protein
MSLTHPYECGRALQSTDIVVHLIAQLAASIETFCQHILHTLLLSNFRELQQQQACLQETAFASGVMLFSLHCLLSAVFEAREHILHGKLLKNELHQGACTTTCRRSVHMP